MFCNTPLVFWPDLVNSWLDALRSWSIINTPSSGFLIDSCLSLLLNIASDLPLPSNAIVLIGWVPLRTALSLIAWLAVIIAAWLTKPFIAPSYFLLLSNVPSGLMPKASLNWAVVISDLFSWANLPAAVAPAANFNLWPFS